MDSWQHHVINYGRQEEPAVLISRFLLRMRRMYVASISFGLPLRMNGMPKSQFAHKRIGLLRLVIWSRLFWPAVKTPRNSQRVVTFGYY